MKLTELGMARLAQNILDQLDENPGGFTLAPIEFTPVDAEDSLYKPTGYAVAGIVPGIVTAGRPTVEEVIEFIQRYLVVTRVTGEDVYIGGWRTDDDETTYIDAVLIVADAGDAVMLGRAWNQLALGYLEDGQYVKTVDLPTTVV